jgi:hypothetical protein
MATTNDLGVKLDIASWANSTLIDLRGSIGLDLQWQSTVLTAVSPIRQFHGHIIDKNTLLVYHSPIEPVSFEPQEHLYNHLFKFEKLLVFPVIKELSAYGDRVPQFVDSSLLAMGYDSIMLGIEERFPCGF